MDIELKAFRQAMECYITESLRDDELARAKRPFLIDIEWEGITDTSAIEANDELIEEYATEEQMVSDYINFFKTELQIPYGQYTNHFEAICKQQSISVEPDTDLYKLLYREYLKIEIYILNIIHSRTAGNYAIDDANRLMNLEVTQEQMDQAKSHNLRLQENGNRSSLERNITKNPNFSTFKQEVLNLKNANSVLSNAEIARRAAQKTPLGKAQRSLEGYVAKILNGVL